MGTNVPRPWQRPKKPKMIIKCDGIIGEKTKDEILESLNTGLTINDHRRILGLDPVEEVNPIPMVPRMADRVPGVHRTNCPNCCAVITGPICEYCGTRFPDLESHYQIVRTTDNQEIVIPIYVGNQQIDEVIRRSSQSQFRSGDCSGSPGTTTQLR